MPVENNPQTPEDLNANWPLNSDHVKEGAAHIRGVKTALKSLDSATADALDTKMHVGAGGRASPDSYISGYPQDISQNVSQVYRRDSEDGGVSAFASSIHFAANDTWGRLRVGHNNRRAWIQGGTDQTGEGWTAELIHTGNLLPITGDSTLFPMTQKAVTDAIATQVGGGAVSGVYYNEAVIPASTVSGIVPDSGTEFIVTRVGRCVTISVTGGFRWADDTVRGFSTSAFIPEWARPSKILFARFIGFADSLYNQEWEVWQSGQIGGFYRNPYPQTYRLAFPRGGACIATYNV